MGSWDWTHPAPNPIIGYAVGVELLPVLSAETIKEISALGVMLSEDLPRKTEQQAFMFQVGQPQPVPQSSIGGVIFDEIERDGTMKRQLSVMPNTIMYTVARYPRWAEFWPVAERMIGTVLNIASRNSSPSAIVLVANNQFSWSGDEDDIDFTQLIRQDCDLIASNVLKQRRLCHSFHGFLLPISAPAGRRIDNVNFTVGQRVGDRNPADLNFSLRLMLDKPGLDHPSGSASESPSAMALGSRICTIE